MARPSHVTRLLEIWSGVACSFKMLILSRVKIGQLGQKSLGAKKIRHDHINLSFHPTQSKKKCDGRIKAAAVVVLMMTTITGAKAVSMLKAIYVG
jgi:hypothetical protein